jgi:outer membrane protein assembly factor BamA
MTQFIFRYCICVIGLFGIFNAQAQTEQSEQENRKKSFFDKVLNYVEFRNKADKLEDTTRFRIKFVVSPVVTYSPETNLGFGLGVKLLFKPKNTGEETRTSNMPISAIYTLENQLLLRSGYTIFFKQENWMLKGNIGYSKFPQLYYGLGNYTRESTEEIIEYQNLLLEPLLLKRIIGKFFLGGGIRYNRIWDVNYFIGKEKIIPTNDSLIGYNGSTSVGVELAATYDSRDNVLNAYKGSLLEFRQGLYGTLLNGTAFQNVKVDLRKYIQLSETRKDVLALQGFGYFTDGNAPLLELGSLGGDELMRGYYEGRFRDNNLIAAQIEYRFPIAYPLGMVVFGSAGQVYRYGREIGFDNLKYAYGAGLRLKIVKTENLNLRFDVAKGEKINFYFGIAEAF